MLYSNVLFPIVIAREGKWFIASCPTLDIGTQGKTEKEAKESMRDLIKEYLSDPDTTKPKLDEILSISLTNISVKVPNSVLHGKAPSIAPA